MLDGRFPELGKAIESSCLKVTTFALTDFSTPVVEDGAERRLAICWSLALTSSISYSIKVTLRSMAVLGAKNSSILKGGCKSKIFARTPSTFFIKA